MSCFFTARESEEEANGVEYEEDDSDAEEDE
jgi:hypothetical protein